MDATTLVTFLFRAPPGVRTVELLGSWDNFAQSYSMNHDPRRGADFYTGCFKFDKIIYDGDSPYWTKARSGGLKQGGTYWFYYRLDMEAEAYDDKQAHTTNCPLLPGQTLNIIEVPREILPKSKRRRSLDVVGTLLDMVSKHTMDPNDKFMPVHPPPMSKVHGRCISDVGLGGRLEGLISKASSISSKRVRRSMSKKPSSRNRNVLRKNTLPKASAVDLSKSETSSIHDASRTNSTSTSIFSKDPFATFDFDFRPQSRAGTQSPTFMDIDPMASLSPISFDPTQLYGSRPSSSSYSEPSQSGIYSLSNSAIETHVTAENAPSPTTLSKPTDSFGLPSASPESTFADEIWSPTFSIDTIDSNGLTTPYWLSAGNSRNISPTLSHHPIPNTTAAAAADETTINDIAARLQQLSASADSNPAKRRRRTPPAPPPPLLLHPAFRSSNHKGSTPAFSAYALPRSATDSAHSLLGSGAKLSTHMNDKHQSGQRGAAVAGAGSSVTGDLLSELGYLAGCIG